jgi:hypothetical protein
LVSDVARLLEAPAAAWLVEGPQVSSRSDFVNSAFGANASRPTRKLFSPKTVIHHGEMLAENWAPDFNEMFSSGRITLPTAVLH